MNHRKAGRKFSRVRKQRKALVKMLLGSLIMYEKITTTEAKAKETKNYIDKIINKAKEIKVEGKKVAALRELRKHVSEAVIKKLNGSFLEKFESRKSGYTRVIKLAPRKSDSAKMAIIEFV